MRSKRFHAAEGGLLLSEDPLMNSEPADNHAVIDWPAELLRHREWMHGLARRRLGDVHAADDVMQDVSLAVIKQNGRPTDPQKVRPWLYQIVVRRAADHLRKHYRQQEALAGLATETPTEACDNHGPEWVLEADPERLLQAALKNLPEDDRRMFECKYGENQTYRQLAEQFGISERAVEYRLMCARQRLRKEMQSLRNHGEFS